MRSFVVLCPRAHASGEFLLDDVPGTSGRLDIGLRCVRAALLRSHGLRRDASIYLLLGSGRCAPRAVRIRGADVRFLRPDERSLAVLFKKVLVTDADEDQARFVEVRPGIALARCGLEGVAQDVAGAQLYRLDERGTDLRSARRLGEGDHAFFVGGPDGFEDDDVGRLEGLGAHAWSLGPVSVQAEDVVTIVSNELDRWEARST